VGGAPTTLALLLIPLCLNAMTLGLDFSRAGQINRAALSDGAGHLVHVNYCHSRNGFRNLPCSIQHAVIQSIHGEAVAGNVPPDISFGERGLQSASPETETNKETDATTFL
jgi:hypothetical protein